MSVAKFEKRLGIIVSGAGQAFQRAVANWRAYSTITRMCETDKGTWILGSHAADWASKPLTTRQYLLTLLALVIEENPGDQLGLEANLKLHVDAQSVDE